MAARAKRTYKPGTTMSTEEKVQYIMDLMVARKWERSKTVGQLCEKWDFSHGHLARLAAEAARNVRRAIQDPDRVSVDISIVLEQQMSDAIDDIIELRTKDDMEPKECIKASLKARDQVLAIAKTWADITGCQAPQVIEHHFKDKATPQMAAEIMREAFGKVTPEAKHDPEPDD